MAYKRTKVGSNTTSTYNTRTGKSTYSSSFGTTRNGGTRYTYSSSSNGNNWTTRTYKDAAGFIHTERTSSKPWRSSKQKVRRSASYRPLTLRQLKWGTLFTVALIILILVTEMLGG